MDGLDNILDHYLKPKSMERFFDIENNNTSYLIFTLLSSQYLADSVQFILSLVHSIEFTLSTSLYLLYSIYFTLSTYL